MVSSTLLAAALFAFVAAAVYAYVGDRLRRRRVSEEARLAAQLFSLWWLALAGATAITGLTHLAGALGNTDLALHVTLTSVNLLLICAALWGLLYYLVYLFTGRKGAVVPLSVFYAAYYVSLVYYVTSSHPAAVELRRWQAALVYEQPLAGPLFTALVLLLVVPQIVGALAYFTLFFRVRDRTQRYRIGVVSWSIVLWFGSALVAAAAGLGQNDAWQVASRAIGLGAALAILMAYEPPGFLKRRLGVASITDPPPAHPAEPPRAPEGLPEGPPPKGEGEPAKAPRERVQRPAAGSRAPPGGPHASTPEAA